MVNLLESRVEKAKAEVRKKAGQRDFGLVGLRAACSNSGRSGRPVAKKACNPSFRVRSRSVVRVWGQDDCRS